MSGHVIKGPVVDDNVHMGIGEYFWRTAEKYGDRICQIHADTEKKETFAEVKTRVLRVALQMKKMGIQPKDVVMVFSQNDLDDIVPVLAAIFLGAYPICSMPSLDIFDIQYMINDVKPKVIFVITKELSLVEEALKRLDFKCQMCVMGQSSEYPMMYDIEATETEEEHEFKPVKANVLEPAFILYTSGTTSTPKGIYLSHLSLLSNACRQNPEQQFTIDSPIVLFCTMFWISSVLITMFNIIFAQTKIVAPVISAEKFYGLVQKYKLQHAFITYVNLNEIINVDKDVLEKYDLSSMRAVATGGIHIDYKVSQKLKEIFPNAVIRQTYTSTEMGNVATTWDSSDPNLSENALESIGRVGPNMEMKIVDVTTRQPLGPNLRGEIMVKSPYNMTGLTGNNEKTSLFDEDGFYKSGDVGYYDEQGYFYYVERLNEVFKFGSFKIYPKMMEDLLKEHPAVKEAVVIGVPHDTDFYRIGVCVLSKENVKISEQEISDYLVDKMGETYRPLAGVKILNEMPLTANGKIARKEIKKLFLSDRITS